MQSSEPPKSKIFGKGKVYIPASIREELNLHDGDYLLWRILAKGEIVLKK